MTEAALLVLSRAMTAPRVACFPAASAAGVTGLRVRQVAALLLVHRLGPRRTLELGGLLGRTAGQPLVEMFRRLDLLTLTGHGRAGCLSLTESGERLAVAFDSAVDKLWIDAVRDLPESRTLNVLVLLRSVSGRGAGAPELTGFPLDLLVTLDRLIAQTLHGMLTFADEPGLRDAALRPMLLLANGPATPTALGVDLGIGAPAVNLALAAAHGSGLIAWQRNRLCLTEPGERVVGRMTLASKALWLDVQRAGGEQVRRDAQALLSSLGKGCPANSRP